MYKLNRRIPNGTYGGVRGEKFIKNYPLLDYSICEFNKNYRRKIIMKDKIIIYINKKI